MLLLALIDAFAPVSCAELKPRRSGRSRRASFLPRESGEGGPPCAAGWWKGRRTRRNFCTDNEAPSQRPPPPRCAWSPSPASRGRMTCDPVLAMRLRIRVLPRHCKKALPKASPTKKGGGAPTGALSLEPHQRMRPRSQRRPLAFRRSTAALARADASTIGSAPVPRFLRPGFIGRYPLSPVSSQPRSAETGRSAGRSGTQSRPGAACETARGNRTRSTF